MAPQLVGIHRTWSGMRDENGYRTYKITWLVETAETDGPSSVLFTPGLPLPGAVWAFGGDLDPWVWCRPNAEVKIHDEREGEAGTYWLVTQTFSNKPQRPDDRQGCQDVNVDDPLLEPQQVSGGFKQEKEEARYDKDGRPIMNSAWETVRGPTVEFDKSRPTVKISQNVVALQLDLITGMIDTVNSAPLWGMPPRCVKLSNISWERKVWGLCSVYYTRTFEFDVNPNTFDRRIMDEGTKVLAGHWGRGAGAGTGTADDEPSGWVLDPVWDPNGLGPGVGGDVEPDPLNPSHFIRATDRNGNLISVILDGSGKPYDPNNSTPGTDDDQPGTIFVQKYGESDFLLLGIPTVL